MPVRSRMILGAVPVLALALPPADACDRLQRSPFLAPGVSWEKVTGGLGFGEGPAWHPDGYLLFEDVANNGTLRGHKSPPGK